MFVNKTIISIITPVYNGDRFIEDCIKNVIDQNCPDVEHIIVDGGSTDRTVEIIKQYAEKYPHIRWISEKDQGQSDAMNKGIARANGNIVSFLNVDDYYQPNILTRVCAIFKGLPEPTLLVGNCNILDDEDKIKYVNYPRSLRVTDLLSFNSPFPLNPSAYFYHKSLHQIIGLYKIDEHYMMDIDFILKAVQKAKVKYIDEVWGNHRQIKGTKTMTLFENGQHYEHFIYLLNEHEKQLPLFQQLEVVINRKLNKSRKWLKIKYFLENPHKLLPKMQKKLIQVINFHI